MKMVTNIELFRKNYYELMKPKSEFVSLGCGYKRSRLKIVQCVEEFRYDELSFTQGNTYLLHIRETGITVFELTGLWKNKGHDGGILSWSALDKGLKGWNVNKDYLDNFKEITINFTHKFLWRS